MLCTPTPPARLGAGANFLPVGSAGAMLLSAGQLNSSLTPVHCGGMEWPSPRIDQPLRVHPHVRPSPQLSSTFAFLPPHRVSL